MSSEYAAVLPRVMRQVRDSKGISREQLARRLGVTAPAIYNMEHGKTRIPLSTFFNWLRAVKINPAQVLASNMFSIQSEQSVNDLLDDKNGTVTEKIVRYFRSRLKLSQKDLALALGYSTASMIHHFEKGIRDASVLDWCKLVELAQDNLRGMIEAMTGDAALAGHFPTGLAASIKEWEEYWSVHYISAIRQLMRTTIYENLRFYKAGMFATALGISIEEERHALAVMSKLEIISWHNDKPTIDPEVKILIPKNISATVLNRFKHKWFEATRERYLSQENPDGIFSVDLIPASPDHFAKVIKRIRSLQDEIHNMPLGESTGVMCLGWIGGFTPLPDTRL